MTEPPDGTRSHIMAALHAALGADAEDIVQVVRDLDRAVSTLKDALMSSRRIGIAVGIVMIQLNLEEGLAFEAIRRVSMNTNCKLRTVAERVIRDRKLAP